MTYTHNATNNASVSASGAVAHGDIIELLDPVRRRYWLRRFLREYRGPSPEVTPAMYAGTNVRSFVCVIDGTEVGCLRINDKTWALPRLMPPFGPIWQAADAYVVPSWRGRGVLRKLMQHVVENADVHIAHVELESLNAHREFYRSFGFNSTLQIEAGEDVVMLRLASDKLAAALKRHQHLV